jgi:hypothetical protein
MAKHPVNQPDVAYPCLVALEASNVRVACSWPGCEKKARKLGLGPESYCREHRKAEIGGFMTICQLEGAAGLSRPLPTPAERKYAYETGKLPESRKTPVTFENTTTRCADCHGPLIFVNRPEWTPEMGSIYYRQEGNAATAEPIGIGLCRRCTFGVTIAA